MLIPYAVGVQAPVLGLQAKRRQRTDPRLRSLSSCYGDAELQVLGLPGLAPSADGPAHAPDDPAQAAAAGPDGKENLEEGNGAATAGETAAGKAAGSLRLTMACLVHGTQILRTGLAAWLPHALHAGDERRKASLQVGCTLALHPLAYGEAVGVHASAYARAPLLSLRQQLCLPSSHITLLC